MSEERHDSASQDLGAQVEAAERRLRDAADAATAAQERATAEIRALEVDLEREKQRAAEEQEQLRREHAEELERERGAKNRTIAAAESRLAEIEAQAEAAEQRVAEAERRAAGAEGSHADLETRAREAAAAWLRGQIEAIKREAGRR
jgi:predicted  nucleic acid-binding Zn-ribbon protein